jgi:hypothetical protein
MDYELGLRQTRTSLYPDIKEQIRIYNCYKPLFFMKLYFPCKEDLLEYQIKRYASIIRKLSLRGAPAPRDDNVISRGAGDPYD